VDDESVARPTEGDAVMANHIALARNVELGVGGAAWASADERADMTAAMRSAARSIARKQKQRSCQAITPGRGILRSSWSRLPLPIWSSP
jgi:hypothetical protein